MILLMLMFDGFLLMLLLIGLFALIGAIIKKKWPSLYSKLSNRKIIDVLCFFSLPFYFLCCYMVYQLIFRSPLFLPPIAKFHIEKDLEKRYKTNVRVIKIDKTYSNYIGGCNGAKALVTIGKSNNIFKTSYALHNAGVTMEYNDDEIDDFYASQKLTKFLRDETGYKKVLCRFNNWRIRYEYCRDEGWKRLLRYYSAQASLQVVKQNVDLRSILNTYKIEGHVDIYDFYEGKTNYDRIYLLITKLREFNFEYLSINYIHYEPKKILYVTDKINKNIQIYDKSREVNWHLQILFTIDKVRDINSANELKKFLEVQKEDNTKGRNEALEREKRSKQQEKTN